MRIPLLPLATLTLALFAATAIADVTLPKVIGDNMVLQQGKPVPIWGHAAAGEPVTVQFADQTKTAKADGDGNWRVTLDALAASDQPRAMTISGGNKINLSNILVGEVWFCSGQSNMEFTMAHNASFKAPKSGPDILSGDLAAAGEPSAYAAIRLFRVEKALPKDDVKSTGWGLCNTANLAPFSAAAFYFGKELHETLHVPVGLVESSWGGQPVERFTPLSAYAGNAEFQVSTTRPAAPTLDGQHVGDIYQYMIQPLIPYAIRGAIWYQGESNLIDGDAGPRYTDKMTAMINAWRAAWNEGDFSFYQVQLAPYYYTKRKDHVAHPPEALAEYWEAQAAVLKLPNTGLAATIDISEDPANIHPPDKWDVGHRLALLAMRHDYGKSDTVDGGPMFKSVEVQGNKMRLTFSNIGGGLVSADAQQLREFEIAGSDGSFVSAGAEIYGDTIVVSSTQVTSPVAVRYAWHETPKTNLANKDGLPAFPFRTEVRPQNP